MSAIVKGPNPLLRIGHNVIVKGKKEVGLGIYQETPEYNKGGYNHPV
jgi:hypothetical protein